jgi:hypothetical protein
MIYIIIGMVVLFLIVGLAIATYSGAQLEDTFNKYDRVLCNRKITGGQFALAISNNLLEGKINVVRTSGFLTDAYSSRSKAVVLSDSTCDVASVAALTVVAHEFGHASQDLSSNRAFNRNKALTKAVKGLGFFMFPLVVLGIFLCFVIPNNLAIGFSFLGISLAIFLLALSLKFLTIPVERDASKRGIDILKKMEVLDDDEMLMAKDLLKTALLTYIGDFLRAILWWTFLTRKTKLF